MRLTLSHRETNDGQRLVDFSRFDSKFSFIVLLDFILFVYRHKLVREGDILLNQRTHLLIYKLGTLINEIIVQEQISVIVKHAIL